MTTEPTFETSARVRALGWTSWLLACACAPHVDVHAATSMGTGGSDDDTDPGDGLTANDDGTTGPAPDDDTDETAESESDGGSGQPVDDGCIVDGSPRFDALLLDHGRERARVLGPTGERSIAVDGPVDDGVTLIAAASPRDIFVARNAWNLGTARVHAHDRAVDDLAWSADLPSRVIQLWAGDDGSVVAEVTPNQIDEPPGFVIDDGTAVALEQVPLGGRIRGAIPARMRDPASGYKLGWITVDGWRELSRQPGESTSPTVLVDAIEFAEQNERGAVLLRTTPEDVLGWQLADVPGIAEPLVVDLVGAVGPLRLIQGWSNAVELTVLVRLNIDTGEQRLIDPELPAGWSFFDCFQRDAVLAASGAVVFTLHDDSVAAAFAYDPADDTWTMLGRPVSLVDDVSIAAQSGSTFLLRSVEQFATFCPQTSWSDPPKGVATGATAQLARLDPPAAFELDPFTDWVVVDASERCVAYVGEGGWRVRGFTGADELLIGDGGRWTWLP